MYKVARHFFLSTAVLGGMFCVSAVSNPAAAQDKYSEEPGNFMVHVMGSIVAPDASASNVVVGGVAQAGGDASVSNDIVPTLSMSYFFTPNLAVEAICCFTNHDAFGQGSIKGAGKIANTWLLPATITAQYHFTGLGPVKPYVGAGASFFYFFSSKSGGALAGTDVDINPAFGVALQVGADLELGNGWYGRLDAKKIFIDTKVNWTNAAGSAASADLTVDPLVISAGLGYRFDLF